MKSKLDVSNSIFKHVKTGNKALLEWTMMMIMSMR
jgi:hypothetical protein